MNLTALKSQIILHEGFRPRPYTCPSGKTTIGYGRNLDDNPLTESEGLYLLENDIRPVLLDLHMIFDDFGSLPEDVQIVLADMRYNLGPAGFRTFKRMIAAVERRDWDAMQDEMVQSRWYDQVGKRAVRLCMMIDDVAMGKSEHDD